MGINKRSVTRLPILPSVKDSEVYMIAGQSNADGQGSRYNNSRKALLFGNDYKYKQLRDPTSSIYQHVDTVSKVLIHQKGSVWPIFADDLMSSSGKVVCFVPCSKSGSGISDWQPGADHEDRTTLYGSMVYRAKQVQSDGGTLRAVLWWQGEHDANLGTSEATYNSQLDTIANAINSDLSIKLMPCKLQTCTGINQLNQDAINDAIGTAWSDNENVLTGPDLTGLTSDDSSHLQTNANMDSAAALWLTAIETAFGW